MAARKHDDEAMKEAFLGRTNAEAAELLEIHPRTVQKHKARLARQGWSPEHDLHHQVPDGFHLKGASTLYKDGQPVLQWVKSSIDHERQAVLMREACEAMAEDLPKAAKAPGPIATLPQLMAVYPIGDAHVGMRAWGEEAGQDWDLAIAERVQCGAMAALVEMAPKAEQAVIINLGDWFHADNIQGMTSRSGHILDLDGRYAKMIRVGVKVMRQCISSALSRHRQVRVINVIGNHDDTGAIWLSIALNHIYEDEPRVSVETSPSAFMYFEHGRVLVGCHHGHTCKSEKLPGVMAADMPEAWGRTKHRYWYLGHVHHQSVKEYAGVTVESFNTLAAKDAYAAWNGYRAAQNMKCIVLHKEHGEVARHTVNPDMLKGEAA